jgi:hypothetical protein
MSKLSFLLTAALAATASAQIAVPAIFADAEGGTSGNIWRAGTNRVQCVYSGNDFDSRGIGHPISINNIEWRLAGGLLGAAVNYPSVEIYLQQSANGHAAISTTFASNRTVAHPTTPNYAGAVNVNTASGTTPNDWVINLPLTNSFTYYPDQSDLLLEIVILAAPVPATASSMSCGFNVAAHACNSVRSVGSTTALTGTLSAFAPVVRLGYTDVPGGASGDYGSRPAASIIPCPRQWSRGSGAIPGTGAHRRRHRGLAQSSVIAPPATRASGPPAVKGSVRRGCLPASKTPRTPNSVVEGLACMPPVAVSRRFAA